MGKANVHYLNMDDAWSHRAEAKQYSAALAQFDFPSREPVFYRIEDKRLAGFTRLVDSNVIKGVGFDRFFTDYIDPAGKSVYWNPFWRYGVRYSPAELFLSLRNKGYGSIPEAAVNVFWQSRERRLVRSF